MFSFLKMINRRTAPRTSFRSLDVLEPRTLLSHVSGHVPAEVAPAHAQPQFGKNANFSGHWTLTNLAGSSLDIVQHGRKVHVSFNYVELQSPFEMKGKVTGTAVHISGKGTFLSPNTVLTADLKMTDPTHISGLSGFSVDGVFQGNVPWVGVAA